MVPPPTNILISVVPKSKPVSEFQVYCPWNYKNQISQYYQKVVWPSKQRALGRNSALWQGRNRCSFNVIDINCCVSISLIFSCFLWQVITVKSGLVFSKHLVSLLHFLKFPQTTYCLITFQNWFLITFKYKISLFLNNKNCTVYFIIFILPAFPLQFNCSG